MNEAEIRAEHIDFTVDALKKSSLHQTFAGEL